MVTTWEVWERIGGKDYKLAFGLTKEDAEEMARNRKNEGKDVWIVWVRVLRKKFEIGEGKIRL